jgi:hypothetical protein
MKIKDIHLWVEENVFTYLEAAAYLHMTRQGIHKAVKNGGLRSVKGTFILKEDLDAYNETVDRRRPRSGNIAPPPQ